MGSQTKLAIALHEQINVDLAGLKSDQVKAVLDYQIASSLAYALPLPTTGALTDSALGNQWEVKHARPVAKFLDEINREFMIDYSTIIRMAQAIWVFRYRIAYEPCYLHASLTRALCAANIIPGDVVQTLADVGTDDSGVSRLHATGSAMSMIESKRRQIEASFKETYGNSSAYAGVEDNSNVLGNMLRKSNMSSLAAALESIDRDNLSDGEQDAMMKRLNGELDRQISKEARIDGIRSQILKHGKMSRNVVAALESLEPGIITKHPKAGRVRYTNTESDTGVVAALEAINWAKLGKWGLIGALVAFVSYIAGKFIHMIYTVKKETSDFTPEQNAIFMQAFSQIYKTKQFSLSEAVVHAANMTKDTSKAARANAELLKRPKGQDDDSASSKTKPDTKAADDAGKKVVAERMAELPKEVAPLIHVAPVAPKVTPEKAAAVQEDLKKSVDMSLASKMVFFKEDTKAKLKQVVGMIYSSKDAATYESFSKIMETPFGAGKPTDYELLYVLMQNGKIAKDAANFPFVYGEDAGTRIQLAEGAFYFATQASKLIAKWLSSTDDVAEVASWTVKDLMQDVSDIDDESGLINQCKKLGIKHGKSFTATGWKETSVAFKAYAEKAIALAEKADVSLISYSGEQVKATQKLVDILESSKDRMDVGKIDISSSIAKLNALEAEAIKSGDKEKSAAIGSFRAEVSSFLSDVKDIELAALSIISKVGAGIRSYKADIEYMFKTQVEIIEFLIMVERDTAALEI